MAYHGARDVRLDDVAEPRIQADDDIVLRVTSTAIGGSDLHIYRGKIPAMKDGDVLGHEFMGVGESVGRGVQALRRGDRVVVPFTVSCGGLPLAQAARGYELFDGRQEGCRKVVLSAS